LVHLEIHSNQLQEIEDRIKSGKLSPTSVRRLQNQLNSSNVLLEKDEDKEEGGGCKC
jgi:hypothetical protein